MQIEIHTNDEGKKFSAFFSHISNLIFNLIERNFTF